MTAEKRKPFQRVEKVPEGELSANASLAEVLAHQRAKRSNSIATLNQPPVVAFEIDGRLYASTGEVSTELVEA